LIGWPSLPKLTPVATGESAMTKIDRRQALALAAAATAGTALSASASDKPLAGKVFLITGSSSGFGYLGALLYARQGAKVIATMRNLPRPEAAELRKLAAAEKLDITVLGLDVTSDASVTKAVGEALKLTNGKIDVLINNAGIGITGPVEVQDLTATKLAFDTNVFGIQRMLRAVLPAMRARKSGLVVNISSQLGRVIVPGGGHYSATKFALEALSEQLAYELVPLGIDVCVIQPGGYPTKVWVNRNTYTKALRERSDPTVLAAYPALTAGMGKEDGSGRTADPNDVPRAIGEIAAMPAGKRPLRRAVHPGFKPQEAINKAARETQLAWLGKSPYGPWIEAAQD
jgi:NAD(P)-dependent dehydrogenase (short-subunit alcohol dehydrogenase family)